MYKFVWNFSEDTFEKCKTENAYDFVGNVRVGNICFDIMQIDDDASLWIDCYVGGVDSGYGYGEDNYPYDYANSVGTVISRGLYKKMSRDQFVEYVEKELTKEINDTKTYECWETKETINLIDKANEPLRIW